MNEQQQQNHQFAKQRAFGYLPSSGCCSSETGLAVLGELVFLLEVEMPIRFLRPGITTSAHWNDCDLFSQSFYIRILTLVDDYGRYDADLRILRSHAWPLSDGVDLQTIANGLQTLVSNGLVSLYETDGKKYLQLLRWKEHPRSKSRYPDPSASNCLQLQETDSKCLLPSPSPSPSPSPANRSTVDVNNCQQTSTAVNSTPEPEDVFHVETKSEPPRDIEPPPGFPASLEQAYAVGEFCGIHDKMFIQARYDLAVSRGYRDARNIPIRNFASHLKAQHNFAKSSQVERAKERKETAELNAAAKIKADRAARLMQEAIDLEV